VMVYVGVHREEYLQMEVKQVVYTVVTTVVLCGYPGLMAGPVG
jgi:hypothetical protein